MDKNIDTEIKNKHIDAEQELLDILAKSISDEIDNEVLESLKRQKPRHCYE